MPPPFAAGRDYLELKETHSETIISLICSMNTISGMGIEYRPDCSNNVKAVKAFS
jgi:hypothetical protein